MQFIIKLDVSEYISAFANTFTGLNDFFEIHHGSQIILKYCLFLN